MLSQKFARAVQLVLALLSCLPALPLLSKQPEWPFTKCSQIMPSFPQQPRMTSHCVCKTILSAGHTPVSFPRNHPTVQWLLAAPWLTAPCFPHSRSSALMCSSLPYGILVVVQTAPPWEVSWAVLFQNTPPSPLPHALYFSSHSMPLPWCIYFFETLNSCSPGFVY